DTPVTLGDINVPVYHVATKDDHIAPAASVYLGAKMMENADVRFILSGSGHIAGVVNPPVAEKYQYWTNENLDATVLPDWLEAATETSGSWWPDWDKWLKKRGGKKVAAREPGSNIGIIEDAPGSFVKRRFDQQ
ncbi:MAG: alpha/beta hydrolase, partial [Rhodobacteraceae bacterium]|nr:alpha/beta hydrolase [Paracoccaceae bacterium]